MEIIRTWKTLIFLYTVLLTLMIYIHPTISQLDFAKSSCQDAGNSNILNSTYQKNLESLLSSVSSDPQLINYGFYNLTVGEEAERVNAIALCIGDTSTERCRICVDESSWKILEDCPSENGGIVWYNQCLLGYSGSGNYDWGRESIFNGNKASTNRDKFVEAVKRLMGRLRVEAALGNSTRKMGKGEISAGNETVYGLVQCMPEMSSGDCDNCIGEGLALISEARMGARIFRGGCVLRYENYIFFKPTANASPSSSPLPGPTPGSKRGKGKTTAIIVIIVSILSIVILSIAIYFVLLMKRRKKIPSDEIQIKGIAFQEATSEISNVEAIQFDFETIKVATNEFSDKNKLGQGGFGAVYRVQISRTFEIDR
uniref:Gnk2-homologous domain-containing protein n=1 Tax=Cucumis sativus TaxID=3659 RepID=A0A0A0KHX1_CUCSA